MAELLVLRWLARRAALRPLVWLTAIVLLLVPAALLLTGPFGLGGTSNSATRAYYSVAFLGGLAAAAFAARGLGELVELGAHVGAARRLRLEGIVLALFTFGAVALLLVPLFAIAPQELFSENGRTAGLALATAQVVALALFLNQLPLAHGTRSLLLPLLAWVLPALVQSEAPGVHALTGQLDAAALLRIEHSAPKVAAACASILAWVLVAFGLVTRRPEGS